MPDYIVQRHLPGNDFGEWGRNKEFRAGNDEEAIRIVTKVIVDGLLGRLERLQYGDTRIRVLKVIFDGPPSDTGYPYPPDEKVEELEAEQAALNVDLWLRASSEVLDYTNLRFVLQAVPQVLDGAGYHLRLLYSAGYGSMGYASEEEVEHAQYKAKLMPGDVTISAYYIDGPKGAQCISVSKVVSFGQDGRTPKELIHLWPLEFKNLAIDPEKLRGVEIENKREE